MEKKKNTSAKELPSQKNSKVSGPSATSSKKMAEKSDMKSSSRKSSLRSASRDTDEG